MGAGSSCLTALVLATSSGCTLLFGPGDPGAGEDASEVRVWASTNAEVVCASRASELICWGQGGNGQLGTMDYQNAPDAAVLSPVDLGGEVSSVAIGASHICALVEGRGLICWGNGEGGQLGYGDEHDYAAPPASRQPIVLEPSIDGLAAGTGATCARLQDGSVRCWGQVQSDVVAGSEVDVAEDDLPVDVDPVALEQEQSTHLAAALDTACAIDRGGGVQCWGDPADGLFPGSSPPEAPGLSARVETQDYVPASAAIGRHHACLVSTDGRVGCWGENDFGQLGDPSVTARRDGLPADEELLDFGKKATAVVAGRAHTCVRFDDATMTCWGFGGYGALGRGSAEHLGDDEDVLAMPPLPLRNITDLAAGPDQSCAVVGGTEVRCWGEQSEGGLGQFTCDELGAGSCDYGDRTQESLSLLTPLDLAWSE